MGNKKEGREAYEALIATESIPYHEYAAAKAADDKQSIKMRVGKQNGCMRADGGSVLIKSGLDSDNFIIEMRRPVEDGKHTLLKFGITGEGFHELLDTMLVAWEGRTVRGQ